MSDGEQKGLRYDSGKIRHDLLPAHAINELAKVLTYGAKKYAPNNWRKGMEWSRIIGPLKRHLNAIERGEDYDPETGLLHAAHVMCNAAFLTEFYRIYPEGDDRPSAYNYNLRIGIDIDDVLCDFIGAYCKKFGYEEPPLSWEFDRNFWERYLTLQDDEEFWLTLDTILSPKDLPFEPVAYITSRPEYLRTFTEKWLFEVNDYPVAPVVFTTDKLSAIREFKIDRFIDDKFATYLKLNANGVLCYLFDASHNRRYDAVYRRINKETIKNVL
jgi:hypothetical protein